MPISKKVYFTRGDEIMKQNTIILQKGDGIYTRNEYKKFIAGDTIYGDDSNPTELKRWGIEQKKEALAELQKYKCSYRKDNQLFDVEEYALEFCVCDDDGEFIEGSDYEFAKTE